jgi:nucleoside-diphosphate-sugar epimerase
MRIALTGADGFLGRHLTRTFLAREWRVTGLIRNPGTKHLLNDRASYFHFAFPNELDERAFSEPVDVLVHCAFAMKVGRRNYPINRQATAFLTRQKAERFLFISSMSAHDKAESLYGREKLYIESMLDAQRDLIMRPGFVIGDGGVFANLVRSIRNLPVIPLFYGGNQPIQTVHVDDLCVATANAIERGITGVVNYGEPKPVFLRDLYRTIAERLGVRRPFIRLPGGLILMGMRSVERMGLSLPITSENLLGLKHLIEVDTARDVERLGFTPRTMKESLATVDWSAYEAE